MDRNATSFDIDNNYTLHSTKETTDHDYYQREYTDNHPETFQLLSNLRIWLLKAERLL